MKYLFLLFAFCLVLQGTVASNKDYVNVTHVKDTFMATFVHTTPLKDYVIGVSVSTLNIQKAFHNITLSINEAWTDACLDITLDAPLPEVLKALLPPTFLDLRVFYRVDAKKEDMGETIACPMVMVQCDDGTFVGFTAVNGKCVAPCPSSSNPSGNNTYEQMLSIQKDFKSDYEFTAPYSDTITGVEIATLESLRKNHNITLSANEHWYDYCLYVSWESADSSNVFFPSVYKGARVIYHLDIVFTEGEYSTINMTAIIIPVAVFLLVFFTVVGCCMRRRKCRQACAARAALARVPEEPVGTPMMIPADYAVDMYGQQYGYDFPDERGQPIMMVPNGYPVFVPQHGWFMPVPEQQE